MGNIELNPKGLIDVRSCSACQQDHKGLKLRESDDAKDKEVWFVCPSSGIKVYVTGLVA